jgi:transcriptional regulator with XRE-family HTH domain
MSRKTIGNQLKIARKNQKLSQADVAQKLCVDRAQISRIESGRHLGSLQLFERYLTLMGFELVANPFGSRPTLDELDDLYGDD